MSKISKFEKLTFALYSGASETMMYESCYQNGRWDEGQLVRFHHLSLSPAANILNYGQGIFEGIKAYRSVKDNIVMFRPEENARRFVNSCHTLAIPEVPPEKFLQAVQEVVLANEAFIPESQDGSHSLYIRPVCIGIEPQLGVRAAKEYLFYIYVSPVGPYYDGVGVIDLMVTDVHRAAPHGTGAAKAVCNYPVSMKPREDAIAKGFSGVLFLDARHDRYVEEAGAANFFALMADNTLVTPQLGSILPGITRDSIIRLARERYGLSVQERPLAIEEVCGQATECFVCGTGAIITSVRTIQWKDRAYRFEKNDFELAHQLYNDLIGIQLQRLEDPYGWVKVVRALRES